MFLFDNPRLFGESTQYLLPHLAHKLTVNSSRSGRALDSISVLCEDCNEVLIDFLPESSDSERPEPEHVRYEGRYDAPGDVCYVEVFKPGKSPYPMQARQDIVNHSPTGIAWGYGGSGPAQCALAILMDYLGDEARARALHQQFKFRVIARFAPNSQWTLTGRQIENALSGITLTDQRS